MATRKTPIDLRDYLPDQAAADAAAERDVDYNKNVDPKLRARLAELNRMESSPELLRVAPESVTAYVPPTTVPGAAEPSKTAPKVALAVPPTSREMPTQPSLKRIHGEPDMPGVVSAPFIGRRPSMRTNALALAAVLVPVVVVILVMGRIMREQHANTPASAVATTAPTTKPSAAPSVIVSDAATIAPAAAPATSVVPSTTASAAAPPPKSTATKPKPHSALEDPYDAGPAVKPAPSTTPTAAPSATPSVTPSATTPPAPTAEPRLPWIK